MIAEPPSTGHAEARSGSGVAWRSVGLFVLLAYAISWTVEISLAALGVPFSVLATVAMFGPAAAALLTRWILGEGLSDMGLRISSTDSPDRWYAYAWIGTPIVLVAGLLLALATGGQHWDLLANFQHLLASQAPASKLRSLPPAGVLLAIEIAAALTVAPAINGFFAAGEELGWRGHLLIRLAPWGRLRAALAVGVVWGLWHAPLIVMFGYEYPGFPRLGPFFFCLFTVPVSVVLAWLRFRSGSVWPGALAHGALNAQGSLVLLALTPANPLITPPVGVLGIVPVAALAIWLVATGRLSGPSAMDVATPAAAASYSVPVSSRPGFFISLEGIDGAGKSTQGAALAGELSRAGHEVVTLRPSDTQLGDLVRGYLLQHQQVPVDPWTEALLFVAGRVQLLRERILPALAGGAVVIADRYADSTLAYQGAGRGLPLPALQWLHHEACRDVWPDLTFLLDLPRQTAEERQRSQQLPLDRFESAADAFHLAVQRGFAQLAEADPKRIVRVDSSRPPAVVFTEIRDVALRRLAEHGLSRPAGGGSPPG